ncbi:MAG: GTPase HflX [Flavonifractor plautii]
MTENETKQAKNRAVLVGLNAHCLSAEENADDTSMEELADLLETAGGVCVGTVFQNKDAPDPRTFIGEGKAAEVKELVGAMGADMVVVDNPLSPSQQRVLSEELGVQVLDRAALILDIFAQRARSREGRLQVELAQYQYLLPRSLGMWTHLERQEGAIGTRGPGETQLETDRRHIRRKIQKLREELEQVRRVRATQRTRREKNEVPVVAIVGYTNAGKSTLLNRLTGADIPANNRLFDTLDTTTRTLEISDTCTVLLSDTVGFIRKLPHHLVEAFKATLEELSYADLLLHVIDASNPLWREQAAVVERLIVELGAEQTPASTCSTSAINLPATSFPTGRTSCPSRPRPARGWTSCWRKSAAAWTPAPAGWCSACPTTRAAWWTCSTGRPRWSGWTTARPSRWRRCAPPSSLAA